MRTKTANISCRIISAVLLICVMISFSAAEKNDQETGYDTTIYDSDSYEATMEQDSSDIDTEAFYTATAANLGEVDISAPSAILIEKETGTVIYEKDADTKREPASVTKIMTELLIVEALEAKTIKLDELVTVSAHAASMGGSQVYLKEGEQMTVRDMLKAIAISSANDASSAMAEHLAGSEQAFAAQMNKRAAELGMKASHFTNASGLLDSSDHYTTARDIAVMSRELIKHDIIKEYTTIWTDSLRNGSFGLANTNQLIRFFDGTTGLKTGFTSKAGFCISATAQRNGVEYIAVVLGEASSKQRFESARALLTYAFAHYTLTPVTDSILTPVKVSLGRVPYISPVVSGSKNVLIQKEAADKVKRTIELTPQLKAPVKAGQEIGRVVIEANGKKIAEAAIVAAQDSEKLSYFELLGKMIGMLFTKPK